MLDLRDRDGGRAASLAAFVGLMVRVLPLPLRSGERLNRCGVGFVVPYQLVGVMDGDKLRCSEAAISSPNLLIPYHDSIFIWSST